MDLNVAATKPQPLDIVIPDEPPFGSIVLDNEGRAWQADWAAERAGLVWRTAGPRLPFSFRLGPDTGVTTWPHLCAERTRLTLIYKP